MFLNIAVSDSIIPYCYFCVCFRYVLLLIVELCEFLLMCVDDCVFILLNELSLYCGWCSESKDS